MWARWRVAAASSAAPLMRPAALYMRAGDVRGRVLTGCSLSTASESQQAPQDDDQARARRCLRDFSSAVRSAISAEQITAMWTTLSNLEPVVVTAGDSIQLVGSRIQPNDNNSAIPANTLALRMVGASEMLSLIHQGNRHTIVEDRPRGVDQKAIMVVSEDRVLLVSECIVAQKIIGRLFRLRFYHEVTEFVEKFETWIKTSTAITHPDSGGARIAEIMTLRDGTNAAYVTSLGQLERHSEMLLQFENRRRDGGALLSHLLLFKSFHTLLHACMLERNDGLARSIIDEALDRPMLEMWNPKPFILALQACLHGDKSLDQLNHAVHMYRRMVHETGYIATPVEWSLLINVCARLGQHERAIEIFSAYRAHGIAPFQRRFTNAPYAACDYRQYDVAVALARSVVMDPSEASRDAKAEAAFLNKVMFKMLKGSPSRDHVEQMLLLMQSSAYVASANVLQLTVAHFFQTATAVDPLAPDAVLSQFFELLARVPATIKPTDYVLRLVTHECDARGWHDQSARAVALASEKGFSLAETTTTTMTTTTTTTKPTRTVRPVSNYATRQRDNRRQKRRTETATKATVAKTETATQTTSTSSSRPDDTPPGPVGVAGWLLEKVISAWNK